MNAAVTKLLLVGLDRLRGGWCQKAHARDANGKPARFDGVGIHGAPVSYSAYGAVGGHDVLDMVRARDVLWKRLGGRAAGFGSLVDWNDAEGRAAGFGSLVDWNDAEGRTAEEVVALYQDTIAGAVA